MSYIQASQMFDEITPFGSPRISSRTITWCTTDKHRNNQLSMNQASEVQPTLNLNKDQRRKSSATEFSIDNLHQLIRPSSVTSELTQNNNHLDWITFDALNPDFRSQTPRGMLLYSICNICNMQILRYVCKLRRCSQSSCAILMLDIC